jgi:hypothetical protein
MKRSPGRPPLDDDDESVGVHLTMPSKQYDAAFERAQQLRISVPEVLRRDLRRAEQLKNAK